MPGSDRHRYESCRQGFCRGNEQADCPRSLWTEDEVAGMVSYLASSEAAFVTGANLKTDGGFTA
ncbi:SDR family oxidoreductase [Leptolyngbya subtilissima]|uniref:SDR family oxidoreductase n=1 Tax=Leptolyngbya subtilissima TaxID=1346803 RepID=UPI003D6511C7